MGNIDKMLLSGSMGTMLLKRRTILPHMREKVLEKSGSIIPSLMKGESF